MDPVVSLDPRVLHRAAPSPRGKRAILPAYGADSEASHRCRTVRRTSPERGPS